MGPEWAAYRIRWMIVNALELRGPEGIPGSVAYWEKYFATFSMWDDVEHQAFVDAWARAKVQLSARDLKRWNWFFTELDRRVAVDSVKWEGGKKAAKP